MSTKRKFKRDYIMLEAKDLSYRLKEKVSPKAFVKIEVTDENSIIALYAENLKNISDGYNVVAIRSDYETIDLGNFNVNELGKGEFSLDMKDEDIDIKGIAVIQDNKVPLIGFKGNKIDNFEDILFPQDEIIDEVEEIDESQDTDNLENQYEYIEVDEYEEIEDEVYEEYEYVEEDEADNEYEEYEEIEYIEEENSDEYEEYEEIEYIEEDKVHEEVKQQSTKPKVKENITKRKSRNNYEHFENEQSTKSAGVLLMPRQIKKGLKYFKEVKPFVTDYIEETRWWKIEINPTTLCGYTMPYLGYMNSLNYTMYSDIMMQSYKYRHYLFGVQYDEYNKRKYYIYGVPGRKNEQPDKGSTGFTRYQACDNRNSSLGYWLCFVDCKARRIIK